MKGPLWRVNKGPLQKGHVTQAAGRATRSRPICRAARRRLWHWGRRCAGPATPQAQSSGMKGGAPPGEAMAREIPEPSSHSPPSGIESLCLGERQRWGALGGTGGHWGGAASRGSEGWASVQVGPWTPWFCFPSPDCSWIKTFLTLGAHGPDQLRFSSSSIGPSSLGESGPRLIGGIQATDLRRRSASRYHASETVSGGRPRFWPAKGRYMRILYIISARIE